MYGMGNIGTALTTFSAPVIANQLGWRTTVQIFAILVVGMFYQERLNQANRFKERFETSSKKLKHG